MIRCNQCGGAANACPSGLASSGRRARHHGRHILAGHPWPHNNHCTCHMCNRPSKYARPPARLPACLRNPPPLKSRLLITTTVCWSDRPGQADPDGHPQQVPQRQAGQGGHCHLQALAAPAHHCAVPALVGRGLPAGDYLYKLPACLLYSAHTQAPRGGRVAGTWRWKLQV